MSFESMIAVIFAAALGAAGLVYVAKAAVNRAWPARVVSLRWLWRPLSVLVGAGWGVALEGWPWGVAVGAGAGMLTTAVLAAAQARISGMGGRSAGDVADPKSEEIER